MEGPFLAGRTHLGIYPGQPYCFENKQCGPCLFLHTIFLQTASSPHPTPTPHSILRPDSTAPHALSVPCVPSSFCTNCSLEMSLPSPQPHLTPQVLEGAPMAPCPSLLTALSTLHRNSLFSQLSALDPNLGKGRTGCLFTIVSGAPTVFGRKELFIERISQVMEVASEYNKMVCHL